MITFCAVRSRRRTSLDQATKWAAEGWDGRDVSSDHQPNSDRILLRRAGAIDALRDTRRVAIQRGTAQRAGFRTQTPKAERDPTWRG